MAHFSCDDPRPIRTEQSKANPVVVPVDLTDQHACGGIPQSCAAIRRGSEDESAVRAEGCMIDHRRVLNRGGKRAGGSPAPDPHEPVRSNRENLAAVGIVIAQDVELTSGKALEEIRELSVGGFGDAEIPQLQHRIGPPLVCLAEECLESMRRVVDDVLVNVGDDCDPQPGRRTANLSKQGQGKGSSRRKRDTAAQELSS